MHRLRPTTKRDRRGVTIPRRPQRHLMLIGGAGVGLSLGALAVLRRRATAAERDPYSRFPAHAVLRQRMAILAGAAGARTNALRKWRLAGFPLVASDLEAANEEMAAAAHDLAEMLERGAELFAEERELAAAIGPSTRDRIAGLSDMAREGIESLRAQGLVPEVGE